MNLEVKEALELVILLSSFVTAWGFLAKKLDAKIGDIARDSTKDEISREIKEGVESIAKKVDIIGKATQDELRQNIMKVHEETVSKGSIDDNTFYMVTQLYSDYQNLGGNSFVVDLYADIVEIHNKPVKKKTTRKTATKGAVQK